MTPEDLLTNAIVAHGRCSCSNAEWMQVLLAALSAEALSQCEVHRGDESLVQVMQRARQLNPDTEAHRVLNQLWHAYRMSDPLIL